MKLQYLIGNLHERRLNLKRDFNPKQYVSAWLEDDIKIENKAKVKALVIILRTHGCTWARSNTTVGGCSMCGYLNDCPPVTVQIKPEHLITQFQAAIDKFQDKQFDLIKIFTSGSFIDNDEVPDEVQKTILKMCNELSIHDLIIETRPEFITHEKCEQLTSSFPNKLQLAIGLESANDKILKFALNKGFTFDDYHNAVQIAKKMEIYIKTYLLLKPPFLSERDAIVDTLNSIHMLQDQNLTDCISINPVHIQKFTVIENLFDRNDYRPPWLWSVIEVLKHGHESLSGSGIRLLSHPTAGGLRRGVHNCGDCDQSVLNAIEEFSLSNDPNIFQKLDCSCRAKWGDVLILENIVKSPIEPPVELNW